MEANCYSTVLRSMHEEQSHHNGSLARGWRVLEEVFRLIVSGLRAILHLVWGERWTWGSVCNKERIQKVLGFENK